MLTPQSLPWIDPLDLAARLNESGEEACWVLLYSGVRTTYSGRYSYLGCRLAECIEAGDFSAFGQKLVRSSPAFDNAWFGYLGYELKYCLEKLPVSEPGWLALPRLCMMRFHAIYQFDHEKHCVTLWSDASAPHWPKQQPSRDSVPVRVVSLHSNMSRKAYLEKAAHIIERIHAGDLYQANLTRKFNGSFNTPPDAFSLYRQLCQLSPAPYSAFMRLGQVSILSSSPELFMHIDAAGQVRTRPIKGTAPRFADPGRDVESRRHLAENIKDRAENLMITDLMRNDLSRSCIAGSIKADSLFEVTTHATIHHMSSTVSGKKRAECPTLDVVRQAFPPGSMTGAPKIEAMKLCACMESLERGVYSGALGWFGGDGSCELSVVIRTLIVQKEKFEFQVGGAIVADSVPELELQETVDKAAGIMALLGLFPADMQTM